MTPRSDRTTAAGAAVFTYEVIGSTSTEARQRGEAGVGDPLWITAKRQTGGRGRLGRAWSSPEGNFYGTFLTPWSGPLEQAGLLSLATGLAVAEALEDIGLKAGSARLKWPNDVRIDMRKISGVLVETGEGEAGRWASIGIGVNLKIAPEGVGQETISAQALTGAAPTPEAFLDTLDMRLTRWIAETSNPAALRLAWLERAEGLGRLAQAEIGRESFVGEIVDLNDDGALVLEDASGHRCPIRAGQVRYLAAEAV